MIVIGIVLIAFVVLLLSKLIAAGLAVAFLGFTVYGASMIATPALKNCSNKGNPFCQGVLSSGENLAELGVEIRNSAADVWKELTQRQRDSGKETWEKFRFDDATSMPEAEVPETWPRTQVHARDSTEDVEDRIEDFVSSEHKRP